MVRVTAVKLEIGGKLYLTGYWVKYDNYCHTSYYGRGTRSRRRRTGRREDLYITLYPENISQLVT
jgi:hypothetical protein